MFLLNRRLITFLFVAAIAQPLWGMEVKNPVALNAISMINKPEQTSGSWEDIDKKESSITIEWHKIKTANDFAETLKKLNSIYAEAFLGDIKSLLDDTLHIKQEYLAAVESLSKEAREELEAKIAAEVKDINCDKKERVAASILEREKSLQQSFDYLKAEGKLDDCRYFANTFIVMVKNQEKNLVGYALFNIRPEEPMGTIWLDELAILPDAQRRGLATLLISSILKIKPEICKIRLGTDIWNTVAQAMYTKFGFKEYHRGGVHVQFEYEVIK